jgi:hypothetical protein
MSIGRRIATSFRVKANKALDRAEDPRETLDYSYEQQLEMVGRCLRDPFPGSHRGPRMTRQALPKVAGRHHGPRELSAARIART